MAQYNIANFLIKIIACVSTSALISVHVANAQTVRSTLPPAVQIEAIAVSGQQVPGLANGIQYDVFIDASVNRSDQLAFRVAVSGPGVTMDNEGVNLLFDAGDIEVLNRDGEQASGLPIPTEYQGGCYFCAIGPISGPRISEFGTGTFFSYLVGPSIPDTTTGAGIFHFDSTNITPLLVTGDEFPGAGTVTLINRFNVSGNANGDFAAGIWLSEGPGLSQDTIVAGNLMNGLRIVAASGDQAADLDPGTTYQTPILTRDMDNLGRASFSAGLVPPGEVGATSTGLFAERHDTIRLFLHSRQQAPSQPAGVELTSFSVSDVNAVGRFSVVAGLSGEGIVFGENHFAILSNRSGSWETIVQEGDEPSILPGSFYNRVFAAQLNDRGDAMFRAWLNGDNPLDDDDQAIFIDTKRTLTLVARTGDQAVGLPKSLTFQKLTPLAFNNERQVAMIVRLAGPGVDFTNDEALYVTDSAGRPRLIARESAEFELAPGDPRTVMTFGPEFINALPPFKLSDSGQFVFVLSFTDGSQALISAQIR